MFGDQSGSPASALPPDVSEARRIDVVLGEEGGRLRVAVSNDGSGFDADAVRSQPSAPLHFGLDTMVERIRAGGGHATIHSQVGVGTTVSFWVPTQLPERSAAPAGG